MLREKYDNWPKRAASAGQNGAKPRPGEVDIPGLIWYIRALEVEGTALVGSPLSEDSNPIN
ncbi:hypothetical protein [Bradyrhizobium sp.]|uniref:hypothetical protein n=1 Tax=Bradyrhizobium sp. TaxID=376 RepID=UPI002DFE3622|nr:hypothetical protein [Bradyrhizobium sp.]